MLRIEPGPSTYKASALHVVFYYFAPPPAIWLTFTAMLISSLTPGITSILLSSIATYLLCSRSTSVLVANVN